MKGREDLESIENVAKKTGDVIKKSMTNTLVLSVVSKFLKMRYRNRTDNNPRKNENRIEDSFMGITLVIKVSTTSVGSIT